MSRLLRANPASHPAVAAAFKVARGICRRHAPEVFLATAFLPVSKRNAACSVVAFRRLIGEALAGNPANTAKPHSPPSTVGVSCASTSSLDQNRSLLRLRLDDIYADRLDLPLPEFRDQGQHVLAATANAIRRYEIPRQYFDEYADGCRIDATTFRYATWPSLDRYCRLTGGAFGSIAGCILGLTHSGAAAQLAQLGTAARLSRIIRDLRVDLRRGRLYLPLEDLVRFRVTHGDLEAGSANVRKLIEFEVARARDLCRRGLEGIRWIAGDGSRIAASTLVVATLDILRSLERRDYDVFSPGPRVTNAQRLRRLGVAWRLARRKPGDPLPIPF